MFDEDVTRDSEGMTSEDVGRMTITVLAFLLALVLITIFIAWCACWLVM